MLGAQIRAMAQKWRELAACGYSILEPEMTVLVDRLDVGMK